MKNIAIIGHFGRGRDLTNGQTIKTKCLSQGLKQHSMLRVMEVDTHGWKRHPWRLLCDIRRAFRSCDTIIMLPAHKGVRVFAPLLAWFARRYHKRIVYDVIGGWLPKLLHDKPRLARILQSFDALWVETKTMQSKLAKMGFCNLVLVPNFKELTPLATGELPESRGEPLRLCTFTRVIREKGIETAAHAVHQANTRQGKIALRLDVYGPVLPADEPWFRELTREFSACISYKGVIAAEKSVGVLKYYDALLFPTHFYTEGIPGTIIDAYAAGIPTIAARWESFQDLIDDGETGLGYAFDSLGELTRLLERVAEQPELLYSMKPACLKKAHTYTARQVIPQLFVLLTNSSTSHFSTPNNTFI